MACNSVGSPSGTDSLDSNALLEAINQPALPVQNIELSNLGQNVLLTANNLGFPVNTGSNFINANSSSNILFEKMYNDMRNQNEYMKKQNEFLNERLTESQKQINDLLEEVKSLKKILNQRMEIPIPETLTNIVNTDNTKKRKKSKTKPKKTTPTQNVANNVNMTNENFPSINSTDSEEIPTTKKLKTINTNEQVNENDNIVNPNEQINTNVSTVNIDMDSDWENKDPEVNDDSDNESLSDFKVQPPKRERIPPIIIRDPNHNWTTIKHDLKEINITNFTGKIFGDEIKIKLTSTEDFRKTKKHLDEKQIEHHTFQLQSDKPLRVVLKNIPKETSEEEIDNALTHEGFTISKVKQMHRFHDGARKPLPSFIVTMPKNDKNKEIFDLTYLLQLKIKVESYRGRNRVTQCFRCQGFNHVQSSCGYKPKCLKCAEDHLTYLCQKDKETPPKCTNCNGPHPANAIICPNFPKLEVKTNYHTNTTNPNLYQSRTRPDMSYASALTDKKLKEIKIINNDTMTVVDDAKNIMSNLRDLISEVKSSGIIDLLKELKNRNNNGE